MRIGSGARARFSGHAEFGRTRFSRLSWFGAAQFTGTAQFVRAQFSDDALSSQTDFSGTAWFERAQSSREAEFAWARAWPSAEHRWDQIASAGGAFAGCVLAG
ncbi:hypothetical protein ACF061_16020 [Streptomyces sp. NPDC015220]|uniref:hypothetical protein n=1 Tax=Streptomyces sp. NPDC015220 TaxID=3364947 RepID=UPI003702F6EE